MVCLLCEPVRGGVRLHRSGDYFEVFSLLRRRELVQSTGTAAISTDMGSRHIEKGERSQKALFTIHSVNQKIQVFLWRGSNLIDPVTIRFLLSMKPGDHKVCERILKFEKCYGRLLA